MSTALPLFPNQEIGSLAKPVWRIQGLRGEPLNDEATKELNALLTEHPLADASKLTALLGKPAKRTAHEKDTIKQFTSRLAVKMQEAAGLDLVYDGEQFRTEMYDYAVKRIRNFEPRGFVRSFDNRYYLKQAVTGDVGIDQPYHAAETAFISRHASKLVKIPITGAYTLADWSFDEHYISKVTSAESGRREQLNEARRLFALDLARNVIRPNLKALIDAGAHTVQIDEPAATTKPHEVPLVVETFNESVKGLDGRFTMHICFSDYNLLFPQVLELDRCAQLTLECANQDKQTPGTKDDDRPGLHYLRNWREHGAEFEIGLGVTDVHTDTVETPQLVRDRILYAAKVLEDPAKVWVNPDCGLRTRTWAVARRKLDVQVEGCQLARSALGTEEVAPTPR